MTSALTQLNIHPQRSVWQRLIVVLLCELVVLQPGLATAQVAQLPNFTVTGLPPNVMLTFDDSASMGKLTLPIPPDLPAMGASRTFGSYPVLRLNTGVGYFGIRGIGYAAGPLTPASLPQYDASWNFIWEEIRERSAAFNPLAYNPKIQYKPWNNNGVVMPPASYGGNGLAATVPFTAWDMRNLPTAPFAAAGVTVLSKIPDARGNIQAGGAARSFASPTGSVAYAGLSSSTNNAGEGVDLFSSTIRWRNPYCASPGTQDSYGWTCPVGGAWITPSPSDCDEASEVGNELGQCCSGTVPGAFTGNAPGSREWSFQRGTVAQLPPGPPAPPMSGYGGEACNVATPFLRTDTNGGYDCETPVCPAPRLVACGVGLEPPCYVQDPCTTNCPGTRLFDVWRCDYTYPTYASPTCPAANISPQRCAVTGTNPTCGGLDVLTPTSPAQYVDGYWPPARYVIWDPATPIVNPTPADRADASNYRMVMIDRKFSWMPLLPTGQPDPTGARDPSLAAYRYQVVDAVTGQTSYRPDCDAPPFGTGLPGQNGTWCTFEQEAQNYANWFTYYRTRMFSTVAVMSDVLSNFTGAEQRMRMGYGKINYFQNAPNPWDVSSLAPFYTSLPPIDGRANPGAIERGVREFLVSDPIGARRDVFKWLFSIGERGPTPNREALHAVGRYFQRSDPFNPYVENPHPPAAAPGDELWCRRNYTILATDGEWTKLPGQPNVEGGATFSGLDDPVTSGATSSMSTPGAPIGGILPDGTPRSSPFVYNPAAEVQITGGSGTQTTTLTDIAHYYWSHDLRPEATMKNGLVDSPTNRAFWQHLSTYIVGYGVSASMDTDTVRPQFLARNLITWPVVGLEACRRLDSNAEDDALPTPNCAFTVAPSGNRINDTLRAGLAGGGDFFSAASPTELRDSLAAVFEAIIAENAAGTTPSFSNTTLGAGSVFVRSRFRTNVWDGYVEAYDAQAYLDFLGGVGAEPPALWSTANALSTFAPYTSRNIGTSTARNTATTFFWGNLDLAQQNDLDPLGTVGPILVDYLRGDPSKERRATGGIFRDRRQTILGDIVNSSPVYSKALDHAYHLQPAASFNSSSPHGYIAYRSYITAKNNAARIPIVMFGANDGMFHVLDATASSGREIFAYVPRAVYPLLRQYSNPAYLHRYTVDGPVIEGDVWDGSIWRTIAIGTTGAGPSGIFAIDITNPSGLNETKVLWDIVPSDDVTTAQYLGKAIGAGVIGSVRLDADSTPATTPNGTWAYVVGNGYESTSDRAALLVFNVFNGNLIRAIPVPMSAGPNNGLGAITPVYDGNRNIINVYAGDKRGNLWKFDLTSSNPANWKIANEQPAGTARALFEAGTSRPIVQAPRVTVHPRGGLYVTFGTGKYFEVGDPSDNADQAIFAVWDKGQLNPIASSDVPQIRIQEYASGGQTFKRLDALDLAAYRANTTAKGFSIRLRPEASAGTRERIIAPLILDAGVLVATSFSPEGSADRCIPGGTSFLYRIDLAGAFTRGSFGTEGAVTIGRGVNPGTVGSLTPVYTPLDPGTSMVDSISSTDLNTMMSAPKYRMSGTQPVQTGLLGTCLHVGLNVSGGVARIPTNCVGLLPLRAWRPFR